MRRQNRKTPDETLTRCQSREAEAILFLILRSLAWITCGPCKSGNSLSHLFAQIRLRWRPASLDAMGSFRADANRELHRPGSGMGAFTQGLGESQVLLSSVGCYVPRAGMFAANVIR